ncbi:TAXI family TRAP transporter solute-binding subunit [Natrinema sp. J7-2]|uniref:TAXI family TRAP transporter solute-binding subunit n=1 Tax=Natrinema sp. (strain J7-2) TaxID=406552 RepID=UPI0002A82C63|nr:TAXI family TRAP transporter solute-binding subunit [Natrinema sp. J7-2]AFO57547.2 TRAP transporter solute receptor, TAXI family [Natrinema sp. J7-2]
MTPTSRRDILKVASGVGAVSLAGCLGGSGNSTSLSVGIPSSTTTTGAASNSFQRVVKEQSGDTEPAGEIRWQNQETGGDPPSLRQFSQGNLQALTAGNFIAASAKEDQPPFAERPLKTLPNQLFSISSLHMHVLSVNGSGIETIDDLVGSDFWALPPSWGLRQQAEAVFSNAGLWSELQDTNSIVNADTGDVAGLIEEGNIDALIAYGAGFQNLAGWATEVDARADLQLVEFSDNLVEAANDTRGTSHSELDVYGWEKQDFQQDQMDVYGADFQFWLGSDVSRDIGYELARISNENTESIQEGQPAYLDHSDPESMASLYLEDMPIHPGPYDFLEEQGVDMSTYTRGGE